jgi:hypothetical protein
MACHAPAVGREVWVDGGVESWSLSEGSADASGEVDSPVDSGDASERCFTCSSSPLSVLGLAERDVDMV